MIIFYSDHTILFRLAMGTIFQQILDSENVFKTKSSEISEKQDQIINFKKQIEKLKSHTKTVNCSNVDLRARIEDQTADRDFLLQKVGIVKKQIGEMQIKIDAVKLEHNTLLLNYQKSREDLTNMLSTHSERIMADNANLKQMNPQKYEEFCGNKLELEGLKNLIKGLNIQLNSKNLHLEDISSKIVLMRNTVSITRSNVESVREEMDNVEMSSGQTSRLSKMKSSISNYEAEISSMVSEINNKRQYIKNFKSSVIHNHTNYMQRQSPHFNQPGPSRTSQSPYNFKSTYQPNKAVPSVVVSERMVITRPPVPSSTPDEEDMFDDDVISEEVLRACDEVQKSSRGF